MGLVVTLLLAVAAVAAAALLIVLKAAVTVVLQNEYPYWGHRLAERLIRLEAWLVPKASRETWRQTWLGELDVRQGRLVLFALSLSTSGPRMHTRAAPLRLGWLRQPSLRTARASHPLWLEVVLVAAILAEEPLELSNSVRHGDVVDIGLAGVYLVFAIWCSITVYRRRPGGSQYSDMASIQATRSIIRALGGPPLVGRKRRERWIVRAQQYRAAHSLP